NRIVAGITKLRQGTEIIGAGDLDYQVDVGSQDEIGDLAHAFNEMTHRLRQSYLEKSVMEAQLRQQQKLESIGTLASGVAHEINNPLMGIINYAELIEDEIENESVKAYTAGIIKEGNRVATIVRNLLSFARQDKESHSPADLKDIIDSSMSLVSSTLRKDQITIEVDVPDDLPNVKCRSQQIQQVVINLLTNAHDALNVRYASYDENKLLRIIARSYKKEGVSWIRITVEDHGPGIPQEMIERIFDPFFTSKPRDEGTGLGLSVSFGIVREHKGVLLVESVPGEYTRFHIDLPADNDWTLKAQEEAASSC
ncbi:MAG: ATP-binding protein, partial [Candidatus Bipolaricaulota bacterium]